MKNLGKRTSKRARRSGAGVWMRLFVAPWDLNMGRMALGMSDKTLSLSQKIKQNLLTTTEEAPK